MQKQNSSNRRARLIEFYNLCLTFLKNRNVINILLSHFHSIHFKKKSKDEIY